MQSVSTQDSVEGDNVSLTSSSSKVTHTSPLCRKGSPDETSATKVFVRVRPFSAAERRQSGSGDPPAVVMVSDDNPCHITTLDPSKQYQPKSTYVFDRCFNSAVMKPAAGDDAQLLLLLDGKDSSPVALSTLESVAAEALLNPLQLDCLSCDQAAVYEYVGRPVLLNALAGYNGCVFAYGQTGSGKTYTMMGPPGTFGAVATCANPSAASPGGAPSSLATASASGKKYRRAATGYAGAQFVAHDTNSVDDAGDSRFQSYSSMTPRRKTAITALRTPRLMDASSSLEIDLTPSGDKTPKSSTAGGQTKVNAGVEGDEGLQGIVPRLVRDLFDELRLKRERDSSHSFRVEVEYYEIYREKVMDLLGSHSANTNTELRVRQSKTSGPYVENLKKKHVEDERQVFRLLRQGNLRRHTASTAMNDRSSRSHAIFVLHLVQMHITDYDSSSAKVSSKVNLVDLAGSERAGAHHTEGDEFKEGVVINISLTVLGRVIDALADKSQGKRNVFCPYRDSVLTWLLMDSLGGNSKTTMVATVSPHCTNFEEACQTLRYASRAKQIVTKVVVNEDPQVRQIKALTAEVQRLKALLVAEGKAADNDEDVEALQDRIRALEAELNDTRSMLEEKAAELSSLQALRRITNTVPSTLKTGNAGAAGTAKELSKAKSDVRRLEAENLLHLQTKEELHRSMERVKALELRCAQLLADLKESQELGKKLEKEKQERDRRIVELQQQLFQRKAKAENSPQAANSPPVSPGAASVQSIATSSTTTKAQTPTTRTLASSGEPATCSSPSEEHAARKATPGKKRPASKRSKGSEATAAATDNAAGAEAEWEAATAELCARFAEEKKVLGMQLHERTDAYRKSQLDVKKLKTELKNAQDALQVLEKRLNVNHADEMRRVQEEVQELRRILKEERRSNKDIRQLMSGPVEERPAFPFAYVADALVAHESVTRDDLAVEEVLSRTLIVQAVEVSKAEAEQAARTAEAHAAQLAALQAKAEEQANALADLLARHNKLQSAHLSLTALNEESVAAAAELKVQLEEVVTSKEEAAATHHDATCRLEEQIAALRQLNAEQQDNAAAQDKRVRALAKEVAELQSQLQLARDQKDAAAAEHARQLADSATALATATAATAAHDAAHAQQLAEVKSVHAAQEAAAAAKAEELQERLEAVQEDLRSEKESRAAEQQRSAQKAQEQAHALSEVRSQLQQAVHSSARAAEEQEGQRRSLEELLTAQKAEAVTTAAALQRQLDELQQTLDTRTAYSDSTTRELNAQLAAVRADLIKAEETHKALNQRAVEQAAAYEEKLQAMREEAASEKAAKISAEDAHVAAMQKAAAQLVSQQQQSEEMRCSLSHEIAELQAQLTKLEEVRQAEQHRSAEEGNERAAALDALRRDLEQQQRAAQTAQTEQAAAHAEELQRLRSEWDRNEQVMQSKAVELSQQLEAVRTQLQRSEEARKHQIERSLQQAREHEQAMEEVRAQLATTQASAAAADAAYEQRVHELEKGLTEQQAAAAKATEELQRQLDEVQSTLQQEQTTSSQTLASQQATLCTVREELAKSEEARKAYIQRSVEQASLQEQKVQELQAALADTSAAEAAHQAAHAKEVAALQEQLSTTREQFAQQTTLLQAQLHSAEDLAAQQLKKKGDEASATKAQLQTTRDELSKLESARRLLAKEHGEALAALQLQLDREKQKAAVAAAAHTTQLQDAERRLEEKTATADATAAALHRELDIQRQTTAAQAAQHARQAKELEDQLAAMQRAVEAAEKAREDDTERFAQTSAAQVETIDALRTQLAAVEEAKAASDKAHEAARQRLQTELAKTAEEQATTVAKLEEQLCETEAQLVRSEQAREEQAEEGMQQAEMHTKSLESLQRTLEANHKQEMAALKQSHAEYVATLERQVASHTSSAQSLRDDLKDARDQIRQMVETQNYLGKQLEDEKQHIAELRVRAENTEKARAESAADAVQLHKKLIVSTTSAEKLNEEATRLSQELQRVREECSAAQQKLTAQAQRIAQLSAELQASEVAVEDLRKEVGNLQAEKAELVKAQAAQTERQREQLVTQQVDTVTELEAQFRAMEQERRGIEEKARQTEESLRATIEKQAKDLRQMREDLDFNMSMSNFESNEARRNTAAGAPSQSSALGGTASGSAAPPQGCCVDGGGNRTVSNSSFASRSASPAVGGSVAGGVAGMLSSFFRRGTTGAAPMPTTASGTAASSQVIQRHSAVLQVRSGDKRTGATTPVRRGSSFYSTGSFRRSSAASFFGRGEATGNGAAASGLGARSASNASMDNYIVEPESSSWRSPSANNATNSRTPLE